VKITMIGTGYVGLVTGTCLAEVGNDVLCFDIDARKIEVLTDGGVPMHEPGLAMMIARNVAAGRLRFTTDPDAAVAHGALQFIAVGTPPDEDGSADMQYVLAAARDIGRRMTEFKVIVDKSTVPVGTADRVHAAISEELRSRGADTPFAVVSNPEFLKEGAAVEDFMRPDRIVVGADDERAIATMRAVYAPFQRNHERLLVMDVRSAELTKYAANAMLATRISFMNELANLADALGADIEHVRQGIGSDPRIGWQFLYPGVGYGGSCFPKDVKALQHTATELGRPLRILGAVEAANEAQKLRLVEKIVARLGVDLSGRRFALWGLAFKPNTDDMREAPSREIIAALVGRGASIVAYDPVAMPESQRLYGDAPWLTYAASPMDAVAGADALVVVTEWKEFRSPDFATICRALKLPLVFDGRNLYEPSLVRAAGLEYFSIGRR
jgi:UDPglucose 6-dehydrogenase